MRFLIIRLITMNFCSIDVFQALRRQAVLLVWPSLLNGGRKLRNTAYIIYVSYVRLCVRFFIIPFSHFRLIHGFNWNYNFFPNILCDLCKNLVNT